MAGPVRRPAVLTTNVAGPARSRITTGRYLLVIAAWITCTAIVHLWRMLMEEDFGLQAPPADGVDLRDIMLDALMLSGTMILVDMLMRMLTRRLGWRRYGWAPSIAMSGFAAYAIARGILTPIPYRFCLILAGLIMVPHDGGDTDKVDR